MDTPRRAWKRECDVTGGPVRGNPIGCGYPQPESGRFPAARVGSTINVMSQNSELTPHRTRSRLGPRIAGLGVALAIGLAVWTALFAAPRAAAIIASRAGPTVAIPGVWLKPVAGAPVSAAFDPPPQRWLAGHRGVDLLAAAGTVVTSAGSGRVRFVGDVAGRGVVVIEHGDIVTTYEPLSPQVAVGDVVTAGTPIGLISAGGHCSNRCVHWGAKRAEEYLDPLLLLQGYTPVLKVPW